MRENESQRWGFNDPDHYFIKYYGRPYVRSSSSPTDRTRDYVALRIRELSEDHEDLLQAYSVLEDQKPLLMKLLNAYYNVGTVRNSVNHAEERVDSFSLENIDVHAENENLSMLHKAIENFINVYEQVLNEMDHLPAAEPVRISGEEFRNWFMEQPRGGRGQWNGSGNRNEYGNRERNGTRDRYGSRGRYENRDRNRSRARYRRWDRFSGRSREEYGYRGEAREQRGSGGTFEIRTETGNISVYIGNDYIQCPAQDNQGRRSPEQITIRKSGNDFPLKVCTPAQDHSQAREKPHALAKPRTEEQDQPQTKEQGQTQAAYNEKRRRHRRKKAETDYVSQ